MTMLKENWLEGVGFGNFKKLYMVYQARYFSSTPRTNKEILLADNTYLAFNDYFEWVVEMGIKGLISVMIFLVSVFLLIKRVAVKHKKNLWIILSVYSINTLCIAAFFTYVFEHVVFQLIFLFAFFVLILIEGTINPKIPCLALAAFISLIVYYNYGFYLKNYRAIRKWREAQELNQSGFKGAAKRIYDSTYNTLNSDINFLNDYADFYTYQNQNNKALTIYQQIIVFAPNNLIALRIASLYDILGNKKLAEYYYKLSISMVPNRFTTRYQLFLFYVKNNQKELAKNIGYQILHLPIKVNSEKIILIRSEVNKYFLNESILK